MGIIAGHLGMLTAMWVVLILIGLTVLARLARILRDKFDAEGLARVITLPVLYDVFPLIVLSQLTKIDPTHILVLVAYYLAALFIIIRTLYELGNTLRNK